MIVDVAGRGQCRDVTAAHGAVLSQAQSWLPGLIANCLPPLMGLDAADRGYRHPAMMGVGVGHHPLRPVEQHQAGTPFGLDQPLPAGRLRRYFRDQRTEVLLVSGQPHQEPAHLIHIEDVARTQFVELSQEVAQRARESVGAHPSHPLTPVCSPDSTARHRRGPHPPGVNAAGAGQPALTREGQPRRQRFSGCVRRSRQAAIRLGFLVAPPPLRRALRLAKHLTDWHCPTATQAALARFIDEGLLARHIRKMPAEYMSRHERVLEVLAGQDEWLRPIQSTAGMHLTALLPSAKHLPPEAVLTRTDGSGVAVNSLSEFYAGEATQCGLVLGYGAVALDEIENGLHLLWRLLDRP
jgi:hypothetical protein